MKELKDLLALVEKAKAKAEAMYRSGAAIVHVVHGLEAARRGLSERLSLIQRQADEKAAAEKAAAEAEAKSKEEAEAKRPKTPEGLYLDGPTLEQYVAAGYKAETYPPKGYAPVTVTVNV